MEINTSLEKTRYLLNSSQERKKLIEDFVTFCNDRWDLLKERKYNILEFSNFLTFKGIMDWKDVTPSIIQSFIILNEENDTGSFELSEWIKSMNDFFTFLKDKNIVKDNPFSRSDILPKEDIEERLTPTKTCLRCGISLDSKIAKYCKQCSSQIKKEATLRWNKEHRERLRESNKRWRQRNPDRVKQLRLRYKLKNREKIREQNRLWKQKHPEKLREYREKYRKNKSRQFKKETLGIASGQKFFKEITASMSDWCKELRNTSIHLLWMKRQKKRIEKIRELENRFNCCWEDKFKEVYERYKHEEAAKILNLDYHNLFI